MSSVADQSRNGAGQGEAWPTQLVVATSSLVSFKLCRPNSVRQTFEMEFESVVLDT